MEGRILTVFTSPLIGGLIVTHISSRVVKIIDELGFHKRAAFYGSLLMVVFSTFLRKVLEQLIMVKTSYDNVNNPNDKGFLAERSNKFYTIFGLIMGMVTARSITYLLKNYQGNRSIYFYMNFIYLGILIIFTIYLYNRSDPKPLTKNEKLTLISDQVKLLNERYSPS